MSDPPPPPEGPEMSDEAGDLWVRLEELEGIADRLAATCADPLAVADYDAWKARK